MAASHRPPGERIPPLGRSVWRGVRASCPACGRLAATRAWVKTTPVCRRCGLTFERIEGHFIGAVGINTIVSFTVLGCSIIVGLVATFPNFPVARLVTASLAVAIIVPVAFLPSSRMLWTAIDIAMRPLEAHEVDWEAVFASLGRSLTEKN